MVDGQEPPCAPAPARALRLYCGKKSQHQGWDVEARRRTANDLRQGKSLACRGDQGRAKIGRKAGRLKCYPLTRSDVKSKLPPTFKAKGYEPDLIFAAMINAAMCFAVSNHGCAEAAEMTRELTERVCKPPPLSLRQ